MAQAPPDFDVGIIGGGPAGASLAAYLAKVGVKCVVFERVRFPRPHVGESLVPSCNRVFQDLDFLPQMEAAKFVHKYGGSWTVGSNCRADIRFQQGDHLDVDQSYAYHVDRARFDAMLLQHASRFGATVYEGVTVMGVDFSDARYPKVKFTNGRQSMGTTMRVVVDASGRRTLLGTQLHLKVKDPLFDQFAIHTWFEGFDRGTGETKDYLVIHFLPITNSWIWQIPITDSITSFGIVTQKKHFAKRKGSREQFFWDCLKSRPEVFERLQSSKQICPLTAEGDFSYAMRQITGDRFLMIGDAARFVDPIFASGVSVALNSARFACPDILRALETGVFTRENFARYDTTIQRGLKNWYEFISLYYRLDILFTIFVSDPRYRVDILRLLRGDVYEEETPPVLQKMKEVVRAVEKNKNHMWHKLLGDLTTTALRPT